MFCPHCGTQLSDGLEFCTNCGRSTAADPGASAGMPPPPYQATPGSTSFQPAGPAKAQTGKWIGEAWSLVTSDWLNFGLAALVMVAVSSFVPLLLQGAFVAGLHIMCMKKLLHGRTEVGDLFKGFNYFVPTLIVTILVGIFVFLGMLACIVPAFVVGAIYLFPYIFIVDQKLEFWPAMEASHKIVKQDYFGFTLFLLALIGLQILGALACIIGVLITLPVMYAAITIAYRDIVGFQSQDIS
ncbi:MAG: zinc-ribbon domain-containing protein [Bryobacteraceae bacterium]